MSVQGPKGWDYVARERLIQQPQVNKISLSKICQQVSPTPVSLRSPCIIKIPIGQAPALHKFLDQTEIQQDFFDDAKM